MSLDEKKPYKNELKKPDRYYTPQVKNPIADSIHASVYEPTPSPETVVFKKNARKPKNESCCLACLLACFLCFAVKGEENQTSAAPPPSLPTSPK